MNAGLSLFALLIGCVFAAAGGEDTEATKNFDPRSDLLSLHYDHAPDKDDGHSAVADRTVLETLYGKKWITGHVMAVSGTYGKNATSFNPQSDRVMDAAWNDCMGWLAGHTNREQVIGELAKRWKEVLENGGNVWVKEGGQSDITAAVVRRFKDEDPEADTSSRIHVVQHSKWNEDQTTEAALAYTIIETHYIKIADANAYLNVKGGDASFQAAAVAHPVFGPAWKAAFEYYNPKERLDFSDTGELLYLLGLGEIGIDAFRSQFLEASKYETPNKAPQPTPLTQGG